MIFAKSILRCWLNRQEVNYLGFDIKKMILPRRHKQKEFSRNYSDSLIKILNMMYNYVNSRVLDGKNDMNLVVDLRKTKNSAEYNSLINKIVDDFTNNNFNIVLLTVTTINKKIYAVFNITWVIPANPVNPIMPVFALSQQENPQQITPQITPENTPQITPENTQQILQQITTENTQQIHTEIQTNTISRVESNDIPTSGSASDISKSSDSYREYSADSADTYCTANIMELP